MAIYILTFNDNYSTRDKITNYFDGERDVVKDWYYCFTNSIFFVSSLPPNELNRFLLNLSKSGRFFISEIKTGKNNGWMPQGAWDFVNKYTTL